MAEVYAVEQLFNDVTAQFAQDETDAVNLFGWRQREQKVHTNARVIWVPGNDQSQEFGPVVAPRDPGGSPRAMYQVEELATVYVFSRDVASLELELEQYRQCRLLFDAWVRAMHLAAYGTFRVLRSQWVNTRTERRFGCAIRSVISVQTPILDVPLGSSFNQSTLGLEGSSGELSELDRTETVEVATE